MMREALILFLIISSAYALDFNLTIDNNDYGLCLIENSSRACFKNQTLHLDASNDYTIFIAPESYADHTPEISYTDDTVNNTANLPAFVQYEFETFLFLMQSSIVFIVFLLLGIISFLFFSVIIWRRYV